MKCETLEDFQTDIPLHHWFWDMAPTCPVGSTLEPLLTIVSTSPGTISQAMNSVKQHHIQNYFYVDILTTSTTPKFSLAFVNIAP